MRMEPFREPPPGMTWCAYCGDVALRARCDVAPAGDRCDACTMGGEIDAHEANAVAVSARAPDRSRLALLGYAAIASVGLLGLANDVVFVDVWLVLAVVVVATVAASRRATRRRARSARR